MTRSTKVQPEKLIAKYPAFHVHAPGINASGDIELKAGDVLTRKDHLGTYTIDSIVSSALRHGDCPIEALDRAKGFGHELVWINQNATVLSNRNKPAYKVLEVQIGVKIKFQGKFYTIAETWNDNLSLVRYGS